MKTPIHHILLVLALLTAAALGQGALTPPGAPAPTMKSLLELWNKVNGVELQATDIQNNIAALKDDARTPITAVPFTISAPGSYYLTRNLSVAAGNGITVDADSVTLDLNGFTLSSTHPTGNGIGVNLLNRRNLRIRNGTISGTSTQISGVFTSGGFSSGILCAFTGARNVHISDVNVSGTASSGIILTNTNNTSQLVENCTVSTCAGHGISAHLIRNCAATDCGVNALTGQNIIDSSGTSVGLTAGDAGIVGDIVTSCIGKSSTAEGIVAINVSNSYGSTVNGPNGIAASGTASYCRGAKSGGIAISAAIAIGCTVSSGTVSSPSKHLGTP